MHRLVIALSAIATIWAAPSAAQGLLVPRCAEVRCRPGLPCAPCPGQAGVARVRSEVQVDLAAGVLRYEVRETFVNHGGALGEADYVFPLPRNAVFRDLRLMINGELVAGETMPAERARAIYEEIVRSQRDPALVEWFGHGMLRARIFPIAPGEHKQVVVRFDVVAEREGDALRVDYFRGTDPRPRLAMPQGSREDDAEREGRPQRAAATFRLRYRSASDLGRAYSPTHQLRESRDGAWRIFETVGGGAGITVLVPRRAGRRPAATVLTHATGRDERYVMLTLSPPAARIAHVRRDVAFVLDVSGSMRGEKLRQAVRAGEALLRTLRPEDSFRIIAFATDADRFRDAPMPATEGNVEAAIRYLRELRADGSTNIEAALEEALRGERARGVPIVLFLTDGMPTVGERNQARLAEMAADLRGRARVFTFGLGADVNVALLEELAIEGRGTAQFVRPSESIERAVAVVASRLGDPLITDLRLESKGVRLRQIYPRLPVDVFAGQDLVILARYEGEGRGSLQLTGTSAEGRVSFPLSAVFPARQRENAFVARLWAIRRIGYLTAERRRAGASSEVDAEIRELGQRFGIPTELSSYLVLEPGMERFANRPLRLGEAPAPATGRRVTSESDFSGRGVAGGGARSANNVSAVGMDSARQIHPRAGVPAVRATASTNTGAQAFEAARLAATRRAATSVSGEDAAAHAGVRAAAGRTFVLRDSVWTDVRVAPRNSRLIRVQPFSALYFALLREVSGMNEIAALGERLLVHGRRITIELHPDGKGRADRAELEAIIRDW